MHGLFIERTYDETMSLLVEARDYLSAAGEEQTGRGSLLWCSETMRLTTRLTQVMAWVLLRRAVANGELSEDEAATPENRLAGHGVCLLSIPQESEGMLPPPLVSLLTRSLMLYRRIDRLDRSLPSACTLQ